MILSQKQRNGKNATKIWEHQLAKDPVECNGQDIINITVLFSSMVVLSFFLE